VLPTVLERHGFTWLDPNISSAIRAALDS
jgi:hypothetical protein